MEWYWFVDGDVDVIEDASGPENSFGVQYQTYDIFTPSVVSLMP